MVQKRGDDPERIPKLKESLRVLKEELSPFAVIALDAEGKVTSWSAEAQRLFGPQEDDARGRYFGFLFTPEDQKAGRPQEELRRATENGFADDDMWLQRADGSRFFASGFSTVHKNAVGRTASFTKVIRDLTPVKRLEEELRSARDFAEAIVGTVRQPLLVLNGDLRVQFANRAFLVTFHVSKEDTEEMLLFELGNGQWDVPELRRLLSEVLPRASIVRDYELNHRFPSIGERTMLLDARRMLTDEGTRELILLAIEDITERRSFQETLQQRIHDRTEDLEKFAYSAAHDLRAPARAIRGLADLLIEGAAGTLPAEAVDLLRRIAGHADQMHALIRDLLQYSKIGREDVERRRTELDPLVAEVLEEMGQALRERGAQVRVERPLPAVLGHGPFLRQALRNLLDNAVKFVPPARTPEIRIAAESGRGRVRVWIEDNGIGIAPEHQARIFEVFERMHSPEEFPGTGVGLAIVRRAVERLGGRTGVASELGRGSRFWFELPGADGEE